MNRHLTIKELKNKARETMDGNYRFAISVILSVSLLNALASYLLNLFLPERMTLGWTIFGYLLAAILNIFLGVLDLGLAYFFIKIACRQSTALSDIFYGFRNQTEKALKLSVIFSVLNLCCIVPGQLLLALFFSSRDTTFLIASVPVFLIGGLLYLYLNILLSQSYYLLLDFPEYTSSVAISESIRRMNGHKTRYFFLQLSFVPLLILGYLSCGIGLLWVGPFLRLTNSLFYLDLVNPESN